MRVCDKCLKELAGSKVFHINIESFGMYGARINSECKSYEVCEECGNRVKDILKRSAHAED